MRTKDVLKEAISAFDGTVILVSHDREFLDGLVERVYEFGGGGVREHIGGIYDFLKKKDIDTLDQLQLKNNSTTTKSSDEPNISSGKLSYEQQKEQAKLIRKAEKKVADCEQAVLKIEEEKEQLEMALSTPAGASDTSLFTQYSDCQKRLAFAEEEWATALEELEDIQK
jgi:ATP-binding cassette subfamily F protein 3